MGKYKQNKNNMKAPKTIAGIQFTTKGIRPYYEDLELCVGFIPEEILTGEFVEIAHRLAKARMAYCYKKLHANLAQATHITPELIAWKSGHFAVKVWKTLESILEIKDVRELNLLQCQQLIRAMLINTYGDSWLCDYNENFEQIPGDIVHLNEEFKLFITTHILINRDK